MSDKKENSVLQVLRNTIRIAKVSFNENKVSFLLILISTLLIMAGPFLSYTVIDSINNQNKMLKYRYLSREYLIKEN